MVSFRLPDFPTPHMRIIFDVTFLSKKFLPESFQFLLETIIEMARRHPGDQFIFLTFENHEALVNLPSNIIIHYVKSGALKWLGNKWWYRYSLPKQLRSLRPALFIAADNLYVKMDMPTCLFVIHSNSLLEQAITSKGTRASYKRLASALKAATALITFSEYARKTIQKRAFISEEKIKLLEYGRGNPIEPLTWAEKESIKTQYAAGCEYFVFAGDIDSRYDLLVLLKAFSQFKKRLKSNMQLVMAGNKTSWTDQFVEKINTFKYKPDVHVITNPSTDVLNAVIGAAYAFVYPAQFDYFPVNIVSAMRAAVPVIASPIPVIKELAGTAVLYPLSNDEAGFSRAIQELFKDEYLRSEMITVAGNHLLAGKKYDPVEDCRNIFEAAFTSKS